MKLVMVDVPFPDKLETYDQKLDEGEFITRRVVELSKLSEEFASTYHDVLHGRMALTILPPARIRTEGKRSGGWFTRQDCSIYPGLRC